MLKNKFPVSKIKSQALVFFLLLLVNFGIYIPWLGLYGDDWPYLYSYHIAGASGYLAFVAGDRPFSAWVYTLFTPVLGEWVTGYHLLLLGLRWLAAWLFWRVLRELWPSKPRLAFTAAAIICIYPGFKQQAIPLEFILHFSVLCLFLFSLWMMMRAAKAESKNWLWNTLGSISALSMFSVEYFIGLEVLRPIFLWILLREEYPAPKQRLGKIIRIWAPYIGVIAGFLYWRVFIFSFQFYQPEFLSQLQSNPPKALILLVWNMLDSLLKAIFQAWSPTLDTSQGLPELILRLAVLFAGFLLAFLLLRKFDRGDEQDPEASSPSWEPVLLSLAGLLAAGMPYWLTSIPIWLEFPWDRPLISFLPALAILLAALVQLLFRPRFWKAALAALFAAALLLNFINARSYIQRWQQVSSYLQQLTIRAPSLQPGTILITQDIGSEFVYYGDSSLTPAINWIYTPETKSHNMQYRIFDLGVRKEDLIDKINASEPLINSYRTLKFEGDTENILTVYFNPEGCLRVLGPDDIPPAHTPDWLSDLTLRSHLNLIDPSPAQAAQLPHIFGNPPEDQWCSAFQQIDLACQNGDWEEAAAIAHQSLEQGLTAKDPTEYFPLIEALIHSGDWDNAQQLLAKLTAIPELHPQTKTFLQKMADDSSVDEQQINSLQELLKE